MSDIYFQNCAHERLRATKDENGGERRASEAPPAPQLWGESDGSPQDWGVRGAVKPSIFKAQWKG